MPIPENSIMQLSFRGEFALQRIIHVRTFQLGAGGTGTGLPQEFQTAFLGTVLSGAGNTILEDYLGCLSSGYTLREVRAQIVWPTRYAYSYEVPAGPPVGLRGATGQALLDACLEGSTALAGRSEVACYKIGPIAAADSANGLIVNDLLALLSTYSDSFVGPLSVATPSPATWIPGIFHRKAVPPADEFTAFVQAEAYAETRAKTTRTVRRGE